MVWNKFVTACLGSAILLPKLASALVVDIQGVRLAPTMAGASCVEIAGDYKGVRIEADQPGQPARICHNPGRVNSISVVNATLVATAPVRQDIVIHFEHDFPPGINGKVVARAKLTGFFATSSGVGVASGDRLTMRALFSQTGADDIIGEPLNFTVGNQIDSAMVDYSVKEQYLIAGPRTLKGHLSVNFAGPGHKLTLPERCVISLDSGATLEDRMERIQVPDEDAGVDSVSADPAAEPAAESIPTFPGVTSGPGKTAK